MNRILKLMFLAGMLAALFSFTLTQTGCGSGGSGTSSTQTASTGGSTDSTGGGSTTNNPGGGDTTTTTPPVVTPPVVTPPTTLPGLGTINVIQNVVFMLQENRSFDSYFGMLNAYQKTIKGIANPDVEPAPLNVVLKDLAGNPIERFHYQTACTDAITPAWGASITQYAGGKLDRFHEDPASAAVV